MERMPAWVWDLVIALQEHSDEHPKFFAQYGGSDEFKPAAKCGCEPLRHVPAEVALAASAIADDRRRREAHRD